MSIPTPSVDAMLGIVSNNNQTATLLDNQRALSEAMRNSMERNVQGLSGLINLDGDRTINIMDRNNAFANQNLNSITSSLKDLKYIKFLFILARVHTMLLGIIYLNK